MEKSFVVQAGHVFDGRRFLPGGAGVLVTDGRVAEIRPRGAPPPEGLAVLDRPHGTLLPGLIDTHVHLVAGGEPNALALDPDRSAEERELTIRSSLANQARAGVTTVRDLGDNRFAVLGRAARADEPTVLGSGPPLTILNGHCAALGGEVRGAEATRAAVARRGERGAQVIKILVSGGAMTEGSDLLRSQFEAVEVRAAVDEAHRRGLPVAAHAHSLSSVELCLAEGVDAIEHCTCLTAHGVHTPEAVFERLAAQRVWVCPTLGRLPTLPPSPQALEVSRRTGLSLEDRFAQVGRFHRTGVRLLAGTDAGIHPGKPHGVLAHAVEELVRSGLPIAAAVAAATSDAAEACGLAGTVGRLLPGARADLIVVRGDLERDVLALTQVQDVFLRGRGIALTDAWRREPS